MKEEIKTEILSTQTCQKPIKNALEYLFELLRMKKKCPFFMIFNPLHLLRKLFSRDSDLSTSVVSPLVSQLVS